MLLDFDTIISELLAQVSEFVPRYESECVTNGAGDNRTVVFGVFSNFYLELCRGGNSLVIKKASDFLESMARSDDARLKDLLLTGFLENIAYEDGVMQTFGKHTKQLVADLKTADAAVK